ncbi:hypothetical protein SARC_11992 [Sphaeroforma arctica JP610]|uniref:Uncharacterized protein n=1 Tax=Sphaeroforma arctica JP610 TaxID=667725 RepID=A0A0L0FFF7_9EUKA|nr:hypothetical protein SARC_11992 [Sphaeroforma arctica JP610]KNC75485.1 hypothetical protein SARC_11992 [Sphaeroforma arctica JP610]|eukprot:XP_014149387.1 hypothetical protein SARC_11992 [Sphaeroforma arctica JP610]
MKRLFTCGYACITTDQDASSTVSISSASVEPKGAVYPPKKDDRSFKGDFSKDADTPGMLNNYRAMMQGLESLSMKVKSPKSP